MPSHDPKELFIIHTKRDRLHRTFIDFVEPELVGTQLTVWTYDDWRWEHGVRGHGTSYRRTGLSLDLARFLRRDPKPFKHPNRQPEIDLDTITRILRNSVVIMFLEPTIGDATPGMEVEREALRKLLIRDGSFERGRPVMVCGYWRHRSRQVLSELPRHLEFCFEHAHEGTLPESLDASLLLLTKAWLVQLLATGTNRGRKLLQTYPSAFDDFASFIEDERCDTGDIAPVIGTNHKPRMANWYDAEDARIAAALADLTSKLESDQVSHGLAAAKELVSRRFKNSPPLITAWRSLATVIEMLDRAP